MTYLDVMSYCLAVPGDRGFDGSVGLDAVRVYNGRNGGRLFVAVSRNVGRGVGLYQGTLLPAGAAVLVTTLFIMYKAFSLAEHVILAISGQPGLTLQLFPLETIVTSNLIGQNRS